MLAMTKKEFKLQFTNLWQMGLVTLGMFVIGEIMVAIIIALTKADDGATLGWLFALIGLAFWYFCVGAQIVSGTDNAIAMSRSRKNYLVAHYIVNLCYSAIMVAFTYILGQVELLAFRIFWPNLPMEFDFSEWFSLKIAILIIVSGVIIAGFLGALIARFGRKAFWTLWCIWMFVFLVLPRMATYSEESNTVLGLLGKVVFGFLFSIPLSVWKTVGAVSLVVCLLSTYQMLKKKAVTV